jgi:hypothetical protein
MSKRVNFVIAIAIALAATKAVAAAGGIAAAPLPDGRLELFVVTNGKLQAAWQNSTAQNSGWTSLSDFSPAPNGTVNDVAVGKLQDGRLQIFVTGPSGVSTCWKQSNDPNSGWTNWTAF